MFIYNENRMDHPISPKILRGPIVYTRNYDVLCLVCVSRDMIQPVTAISCHHGDSEAQNNLIAARGIIQRHPEINIMEIDFVLYGKELISSHDYTSDGIIKGSSLIEWIELVIIQHGRMLWVDLKPQELGLGTFFESWSTAKEEARVLFDLLREARSRYVIDIKDYVMVTSQDPAITKEIERGNSDGWRIVADIPHLKSYIWQYILPIGMHEGLNDWVFEEFVHHYDFSRHSVVAIDKTFFGHSLKRVFSFIRRTNIREGTTIILYTFKRGDPVVRSSRYHIVMQYDFHDDETQ